MQIHVLLRQSFVHDRTGSTSKTRHYSLPIMKIAADGRTWQQVESSGHEVASHPKGAYSQPERRMAPLTRRIPPEPTA
jgi:hypothetical protein